MNVTRFVGRHASRINLLRSVSGFAEETLPRNKFHHLHSLSNEVVTQKTIGAGICRCYCTTTIVTGDDGKVRGTKRRVEVDYDELKTLLQSNSVLLFDVREPEELAKEGKISQAINIPLCQLKKTLQMTEDVFRSTLGIKKPSNMDHVVFYGLKSIKGITASEIACKLGFKNFSASIKSKNLKKMKILCCIVDPVYAVPKRCMYSMMLATRKVGDLADALEMSPRQFRTLYGIEKPEDTESLVFSCVCGIRSVKAMHLSYDCGYHKVKHYPGGFEEWKSREAGQPA